MINFLEHDVVINYLNDYITPPPLNMMSRCVTEILVDRKGKYHVQYYIMRPKNDFFFLYYLEHGDLSTVIVSKSNCRKSILRKV